MFCYHVFTRTKVRVNRAYERANISHAAQCTMLRPPAFAVINCFLYALLQKSVYIAVHRKKRKRRRKMSTRLLTEKQRKTALSESETGELTLKEVRCPDCNFIIIKVFSDISGHYLSKCPKCKSQHILDLSFFKEKRKDS